MANDASRKSEPEMVEPPPGAATPARGEPQHDPGVIEGEATEIHETPPETPRSETVDEQSATPPTDEEPIEGSKAADVPPKAVWLGLPLASGVIGGVFGAALALGVGWFADPRAAALKAATSQMAGLERSDEGLSQANANLDARLHALETNQAGAAKAAALDAIARRVAALEAAASQGDAARALTESRAARADAAKALALATGTSQTAATQSGAPASSGAGELEARVGKLEAELTGLKSDAADLGALGERLAKVETALAAPKSAARVAPAELAPSRDGAAEAILAISLDERLSAGAPFAEELAALARLGADSGNLAALRPFAEAGAPTLAALRASFVKVEASVVAAAAPPSHGGAVERLLDHMRGLVRVHKVGGEAGGGGDPEAVAQRISAALAHGDLRAALEAYGHLPGPARQASQEWVKTAEARAAADAAAQSLRADAIGRLATVEK